MAVDSDVMSTYFPKIWAGLLITPRLLSSHRASPRFGRCADHNLENRLPSFTGQHLAVQYIEKYLVKHLCFTCHIYDRTYARAILLDGALSCSIKYSDTCPNLI